MNRGEMKKRPNV